MEWYEQEVRELEQRLRESPPQPDRVLFYGSSSLRLWGSLENDFRHVAAINLAFGGSTLEACVWFFDRLVLPCKPRAIICYAGDNDLGDGRSPDEVMTSFRSLLARVDTHFPTIPFTMLSIKPSPSRWHLAREINFTNEAIRRELQGRAGRHFIDFFTTMLGNDGRPDESLFMEDRLHVSPKGYRLWKQLIDNRAGDIF